MVSSPATMRARRSALGSDNTSTFSAPRASIANQVPIPTGPAPATSAVPPTRTPLRDTACQPTAIGSTSAPIRRSTPSGTPSPTSTTVPENSNSTTTVQVTAAPAPPGPTPGLCLLACGGLINFNVGDITNTINTSAHKAMSPMKRPQR